MFLPSETNLGFWGKKVFEGFNGFRGFYFQRPVRATRQDQQRLKIQKLLLFFFTIMDQILSITISKIIEMLVIQTEGFRVTHLHHQVRGGTLQ